MKIKPILHHISAGYKPGFLYATQLSEAKPPSAFRRSNLDQLIKNLSFSCNSALICCDSALICCDSKSRLRVKKTNQQFELSSASRSSFDSAPTQPPQP